VFRQIVIMAERFVAHIALVRVLYISAVDCQLVFIDEPLIRYIARVRIFSLYLRSLVYCQDVASTEQFCHTRRTGKVSLLCALAGVLLECRFDWTICHTRHRGIVFTLYVSASGLLIGCYWWNFNPPHRTSMIFPLCAFAGVPFGLSLRLNDV